MQVSAEENLNPAIGCLNKFLVKTKKSSNLPGDLVKKQGYLDENSPRHTTTQIQSEIVVISSKLLRFSRR